jgi:quinol monooxygenase YgiN
MIMTVLLLVWWAIQKANKMKRLIIIVFTLMSFSKVSAQEENKQMVRLAKLVIDSAQLQSYNAFLKEEIETSVKVEPGVLTLYAVAEKSKPTYITILEIYASEEAYKKHVQTSHFLKYKNGTKDMVKSLELVETVPLIPEMKIK